MTHEKDLVAELAAERVRNAVLLNLLTKARDYLKLVGFRPAFLAEIDSGIKEARKGTR